MTDETIFRGGEELVIFFHDAEFKLEDGTPVKVTKSDIPTAKAGMEDVFVRHKARYGLVSLYCQPKRRLLDFPCGSGYASELLSQFKIVYEGMDVDPVMVAYARQEYKKYGNFDVGNLRSPQLSREHYDVIACIEGLEHIGQKFQQPLIEACSAALKPGGTFVVSSPEAIGASGPSESNSEHVWELSRRDFVELLHSVFGQKHVEIISQRGIVMTTGTTTNCLYGVCHRA